MFTFLNKQSQLIERTSHVFLLKNVNDLSSISLNEEEQSFVKSQFEEHQKRSFIFDHLQYQIYVEIPEIKEESYHYLEALRKRANELICLMQNQKTRDLYFSGQDFSKEELLAFAEGLVLSNYSFVAFKTDKKKVTRYLENVHIISDKVNQADIDEMNILMEATLTARTLVNQPANYLNASQLAQEIKTMGEDSGAKVEIFNKNKIEALKMGGLLAVNKGSIDPPSFSIFTYKPDNAVNKQPIVFVGKGVVYDTGGLNIKTGDFMSTMKCDMGGAAAAASAAFAIAKAKLPVYVMALIPSTDNRPGGNAYASGDVITMFDGQTVEVINTDAEGRMILADALAYAKKYDPMLVIDLATLTGAAARAIGNLGVVAMGSKYGEHMDQLKESGEKTGERIVEFPFWDEYAEQLKSEIADMVHLGGVEGGAITAGKFLEKFTDYPYIHLDIAGPAFTTKKLNYRGVGGTGVGVRLLFEFAKSLIK